MATVHLHPAVKQHIDRPFVLLAVHLRLQQQPDQLVAAHYRPVSVMHSNCHQDSVLQALHLHLCPIQQVLQHLIHLMDHYLVYLL
jgi:hypothetical protein